MIGDQADVESIVALRDLFHTLGVETMEFKSVDNIIIYLIYTIILTLIIFILTIITF